MGVISGSLSFKTKDPFLTSTQSSILVQSTQGSYLCSESTVYRYMEKLEAPKKWFKAHVDDILETYGSEHLIQKEDAYLNYGLFVSHKQPDSQAYFNVSSGSRGGRMGNVHDDTASGSECFLAELGGVSTLLTKFPQTDKQTDSCSSTTMKLFVYISKSSSRPFTVEIDKSKFVEELQKAIWDQKSKRLNLLNVIDSSDLILYKVELDSDDKLEETAQNEISKGKEMNPFCKPSEFFENGVAPERKIHVVVKFGKCHSAIQPDRTSFILSRCPRFCYHLSRRFQRAFEHLCTATPEATATLLRYVVPVKSRVRRQSVVTHSHCVPSDAELTDQESGFRALHDLLWTKKVNPFATASYNIMSLKIDGSVSNNGIGDEFGGGINDAFDPAKMPTSAEFESIDISASGSTALMPFSRTSILVRKAYPDILKIIMRKPYNFVVLGQPGIGKMFFLTYILVLRLLKNEPTTYQNLEGTVYWFSSRGCRIYAPSDVPVAALTKETWHLIGSNESIQQPHGRYSKGKGKVVWASSPKEERYKTWSKYQNALPIWMEPVDWCEMSVIASEFTPSPSMTKERLKDLPRVFLKYGQSARICLLTAGNPDREKRHEDDIALALGELKQSPNFHGHPASMNTKVSHALWSVLPDSSRFASSITPASPYINHRIFEAARDEQAAIASSIAGIFLSTPYLRPSAGRLIEPYMIAMLQIEGGSYTIRPFPDSLDRKVGKLELKRLGKRKLSSLYFSDIGELPRLATERPGKVLAPRAPNFLTVDAVMFRGGQTWLFHMTTAARHPITTKGLDFIKNAMGRKFSPAPEKRWKVVIVTLKGEEIKQSPVTGEEKEVWEKNIELYTLTLD